jgi:hypothetical protein
MMGSGSCPLNAVAYEEAGPDARNFGSFTTDQQVAAISAERTDLPRP